MLSGHAGEVVSLPRVLRRLSLRDVVPGSYTRALVRAQTGGEALRIHVGARMLPAAPGSPPRQAVVGWYHSPEAHAWRLEQLEDREAEMVAVLRGVWEAAHHARQRGVAAEIVIEPGMHRRISAHLERLTEAVCSESLSRCNLGVPRACSQLLRRVHATLGAGIELSPGWSGLGLPGQLREAARMVGAGAQGYGVLRTDARHAGWLREWAAAQGYTTCHTDGSAAGNGQAGGWAWWVDEDRWDAGRCAGPVSSNSAELEAVTRALRDCTARGRLLILTDSVYVLRVLSGAGGSLTEQEARRLAARREARFALVKGHQDPAGHDRADELAWAAYHRPAARRGGRENVLAGLG